MSTCTVAHDPSARLRGHLPFAEAAKGRNDEINRNMC